MPLKVIATATTLAIPTDGPIIVDPSAVEISRAKSVHALGFTSGDDLLLAECEGEFSPDEWTQVLEAGEKVCCRTSRGEDGDVAMEGDDQLQSASVKDFIRSVMESKLAADLAWR